ncbi:PREDICTED: reticulon-3 isoform X1 [Pseudopodoces humilis]|uniref:reticulon-3 isoform X1 n=1 Tax=Pseudopodoces humilis TaxID=181119 RepID=UPI0006B7B3A0|nr:PREDICTED: reticulon-3 isoform X1 [Pseudopodoces humilis]
MADSAAQFSLVSSTSSSSSVTSSSASSARAPLGGCTGGNSMSCAAVWDLLFWRDVRRSAVAFGASVVLLLSLATLSAVTVVAHVALALLSVTISLRVYKAVVQALQKSEEGHPFKAYLDLDVTLSPETFQAHAAVVAQHLNRGLQLLVRLFLVEDLVDSLELAVAMWLMTYVGAVFNGITLLILADILAFSVPPLYEKYEVQINHYVVLVRRQTKDLMAKIQAKLPGLAKKKPE